MSVVLVLATVGFTAFPGVFEGQKEKKAAADIAVIQTALEQYRTRFGTYPKPIDDTTNMGEHLFNALNGKISGHGDATQVKPMLNLSVLDTANSNMPDFNDNAQSSWVTNHIIDPWGNEYVYRFDPEKKVFGSWNNYGYVLFSQGPDEDFKEVSAEGIYDSADAKNVDNVNAE